MRHRKKKGFEPNVSCLTENYFTGDPRVLALWTLVEDKPGHNAEPICEKSKFSSTQHFDFRKQQIQNQSVDFNIKYKR